MKDDKTKEKEEQLINLVSKFSKDMLNSEYEELSVKLVKKMGRKHDVPFKRGKLQIWASAVIYALAQVNFLFDKSFEPYISADDICSYFNTKKSTVSSKARGIRDMFNDREFYSEFTVKSIKGDYPTYVMSNNGLIVPASENEILFARAFMLFEDGNVDEALNILNTIEQDSPDYPRASFYKDYILEESGQNKEISHDDVDFNNFNDVFAFAMTNYRLGNFEYAVQLFNDALRLKPNDLEALYNLSLSYAGDLNFELAVETLDLAIDINPNDPRFWNDEGNYLSVLENFEEAIECFDKAIELHPDEIAWNNKAFIYVQLNNFDEAFVCYDEASKLAPDSIRPILGKVKVYLTKLDIKNAGKYLKRAERIDSENVEYLALKAHFFMLQKKFKKALKFFDKALNIDSESGELWISKALCHSMLREVEESKKALNKAGDVDPMALADFIDSFSD